MRLDAFRRTGLAPCMAALVLAGAMGCVQTSTDRPARGSLQYGDLPGENSARKGGGPGGVISPEVLTAADRCPARLHQIEGAIFNYYIDHRDFPAKLEDLLSYDSTLNFTCPDTGQPFAYVPAGLRKPGGTKRIVVFDSVMNGDGTRWCIVFSDSRPGGAQSSDVVKMADPLFRGYQ